MAVIAHGTRLSILLALASSNALALHGLVKRPANVLLTGTDDWLAATGCRREGDSVGDEKERRYKPMKKSSLRAQQINRTVCRNNQQGKISLVCMCTPTLL